MIATDINVDRWHEADCHILQNARPVWSNWWLPNEVVHRDSIGRRPRPRCTGERWLVLKCNAINCSARVLVRESALLYTLSGTLSKVPVMESRR